MNFETRAIHAGQPADPATGATVVPIHLSSTFTQQGIGEHQGYEYSRTGNPTRAALEECLASLEGGRYGLSFASGLAAIDAVLALLQPGDHVISIEDVYGGTYRLFEQVYRPRGLTFSYVSGQDPDELQAALTPQTRLLWVETPTNPLLQLVDIAALSEIATAAGVRTVVDNTFASPYLQQPLALGADVVVHSTTKYLGGHSDVIGGAIVLNDEDWYQRLKFRQNAAGAVPGPFEAWLTLRGIKTLAVRMDAHQRTARRVAEFLQQHELACNVRYPGLPSHPQHELAKRQMKGFGGMVTFEIVGGRAEADRFVRALKVFSFAESLGGVESLACYPPAMTHGSFPTAERQRRGITDGLIRLSVGLEHVDDLMADLDRALLGGPSREGRDFAASPPPCGAHSAPSCAGSGSVTSCVSATVTNQSATASSPTASLRRASRSWSGWRATARQFMGKAGTPKDDDDAEDEPADAGDVQGIRTRFGL